MFNVQNPFISELYGDSEECFGMAEERPDPIQDVSVTSPPKESKLKKTRSWTETMVATEALTCPDSCSLVTRSKRPLYYTSGSPKNTQRVSTHPGMDHFIPISHPAESNGFFHQLSHDSAL